jgi:uncharacterized protein YecE (DUF72 family)
MHEIAVGTSGWSYDHWVGSFYPEHTAPAKRLAFYSTRLPTVEIDATFYRTPSEKAVLAWRDTAPPGFVFAVKGSRYITQFRRLRDVAEPLATFMGRIGLLGDTLGVVLWQLPANMKRDDGLLGEFLGLLPKSVRHAVEFRHESWLNEDTLGLLAAHRVAQVHVSSDTMAVDLRPTTDFVYVRFHDTATYHGRYLKPALEPWARFFHEQAAEGRTGFAYFNNDAQAHAPRDAVRLIRMLGDDARRANG